MKGSERGSGVIQAPLVRYQGVDLPDGMTVEQAAAAGAAILDWETSNRLPIELAVDLFQLFRRPLGSARDSK